MIRTLMALLALMGILSNLSAADLIIHVTGLRSMDGTLQCALYTSLAGYPTDPDEIDFKQRVDLSEGIPSCIFKDLPRGEYAVAIYHDENGNNKMDTNWIGIPTEGTAASNDAQGNFGPPEYRDARFLLSEDEMTIRVKMRY